MIDLEKIKQEKQQPAPAPYLHHLLLIFQIPSLLREGIKIHSSPSFKGSKPCHNNVSFHFRLCPGKLKTKFFKKSKKPNFAIILGPFAPFWRKINFPRKKAVNF